MTVRLNSFGEIESDENCYKCCQKLTKTRPICLYCGCDNSIIVSGKRAILVEKKQIAPLEITIEKLEDWASRINGMALTSIDAKNWAQHNISFFQKHDFYLFEELFNWACDNNKLSKSRFNTAIWAKNATIAIEQGISIEDIRSNPQKIRPFGECL